MKHPEKIGMFSLDRETTGCAGGGARQKKL